MIPPWKIFGRLGNQMFQYAFLYSHAQDHGIDHYFQDPYYFEGHENAVRGLFSADIPPETNAVAIHIRRGDYVGNPFYVDLTETDYYKNAIEMFPEQRFLVFSDDPAWCTNEWKLYDPKRMKVSLNKTEVEDMNFMASCKAHIIANSSFSWWGAWLSPSYPDNKVIAPKEWFTDGIERTILPAHWKRI